jgi:hypothetical protein
VNLSVRLVLTSFEPIDFMSMVARPSVAGVIAPRG